MPNQLYTQTSPYLLQHANNPVDWHPWGETALELATAEDKPILLSIGYSACHWCHVMERESFEDDAIATLMNELFVCIKVDREERPDLDKIYQSAHQILSQRPGGWPLTVALTPSGHAPFFAGTYFPPQPRMGMPGFGAVLEKVAAHYRQHRQQMENHHHSFQQAMTQLNPMPAESSAQLPSASHTFTRAAQELSGQFDLTFGGFGDAPKFPHPTQLELLLRHGAQHDGNNASDASDANNAARESLRFFDMSLRKMAEGGLFDQLGGGFFRYSVDRQWRIPHFEKMLYDNAQLLTLYSDGWRYFRTSFYRTIVAHTADWVMREMQSGHGGYASTLDADSEGVEGKYYAWSETDLRTLLNADEYAALEEFYHLAGEPNFEGKWHLTIRPEGAAKINGDVHNDVHDDTAGTRTLQNARAKLLANREQRIRPALDDKILTAWNGLMIKGMARAAIALERDDFAKSAHTALEFIRTTMWHDNRLCVTSRHGKTSLNGYLDDYAFLAEGIVELLQAKWRSEDLAFAVAICDAMLDHFEDVDAGGFFFTSHDHEKLLHRPKPGPDDAIPSGNGAAVRVLCKLGHLLGNTRYLDSAQKTLTLFAAAIHKMPSVYGALSMALQTHEPHAHIIIRGREAEMHAWQTMCRHHYHPENITLAIPTQTTGLPDALAQRKAQRGTVAYICRGTVCSAAINSLEELESQLTKDFNTPSQK